MKCKAVFACTDGGLAGELLQDYSRITRVNNITNPSQCRPAKTIKRDWLPEKIIGCHSEKIVKISYGIKISASEALSYSQQCIFLSLSFYSLFPLPRLSNHSQARLFIFLPLPALLHWLCGMNSQNLFRELKSLCSPPSLSVFHFTSLPLNPTAVTTVSPDIAHVT